MSTTPARDWIRSDILGDIVIVLQDSRSTGTLSVVRRHTQAIVRQAVFSLDWLKTADIERTASATDFRYSTRRFAVVSAAHCYGQSTIELSAAGVARELLEARRDSSFC